MADYRETKRLLQQLGIPTSPDDDRQHRPPNWQDDAAEAFADAARVAAHRDHA